MNMVAPYTRVHRRYEVQKTGERLGAVLHVAPLRHSGFESVRADALQPGRRARRARRMYNWFTNREGMLKFWRGGVTENKDIDVIWPVGMRGTEDRPFTFPAGTTDEQKAATFREVIGEQVKMVRDVLPKDKTPLFHFTMYAEMLPAYQRIRPRSILPEDVMIIWPDDNDGHMRGLPTSLGKWKHGVYYHLAYLGGNLSKQTTHTETPAVVAEQFEKIVKAGATEYMLVNVSEVRDYVMGARMIGDICWDAPAIYRGAERRRGGTQRGGRGNISGRTRQAADGVYAQYFALLDKPDTMWNRDGAHPEADRRACTQKVGGGNPAAFSAETLAELRTRAQALDDALAAESRPKTAMPISERAVLLD